MGSPFVGQLFVMVNATFRRLHWNVNVQNNIMTFKGQSFFVNST